MMVNRTIGIFIDFVHYLLLCAAIEAVGLPRDCLVMVSDVIFVVLLAVVLIIVSAYKTTLHRG